MSVRHPDPMRSRAGLLGLLLALASPIGVAQALPTGITTRIIGGTPEDRCKSDALFLTANARSCAISTAIQGSHGGE